MADNIQRGRGTPGSYKTSRGGTPNEPGPFIGEVMNSHDPARIGRIQVYIPEFASTDKTDATTWRTVRYMSPFFGNTPQVGSPDDAGTYYTNPNSYGMMFTVPDVGVKVLCFFVGGDPNQGYYMGCIPDPDAMHMVPAIGANENYAFDENNPAQEERLLGIDRLPVAELNKSSRAAREDSQFFNVARPLHNFVAGSMYVQGVIEDRVRGVVGSSAYRESPSNVYGILTPGRPLYANRRLNQDDINMEALLNSGELTESEVQVVGRRPGHSFVMDDGSLAGEDQLMRLRTAKGHQITMSDDGNAIHIMHANGYTWIELGNEGTVDVYSTNSVNVRTEGDINMHADRDINIHAGRNINMYAAGDELQPESGITIETPRSLTLIGSENVIAFSDQMVTLESDGTVVIESSAGTSVSSRGGDTLVNGNNVHLNSKGSPDTATAWPITQNELADTTLDPDFGWVSMDGELTSIVKRAPTHEPFDGHGTGIDLEQD